MTRREQLTIAGVAVAGMVVVVVVIELIAKLASLIASVVAVAFLAVCVYGAYLATGRRR